MNRFKKPKVISIEHICSLYLRTSVAYYLEMLLRVIELSVITRICLKKSVKKKIGRKKITHTVLEQAETQQCYDLKLDIQIPPDWLCRSYTTPFGTTVITTSWSTF